MGMTGATTGVSTGESSAWLARAAAGESEAERHLQAHWRPRLAAMLRERLAGAAPVALADAGALVQRAWTEHLRAAELVPADRGLYLEWAARLMQSLAHELALRSAALGADPGTTRAESSAPSSPSGKARRRGRGQAPERAAALPTMQALAALASLDQRLARIVRLRWFAALSMAEIAMHTDTDELSVQRDWLKARAFLLAALPAATAAASAAAKRRGERKRAGDTTAQADAG